MKKIKWMLMVAFVIGVASAFTTVKPAKNSAIWIRAVEKIGSNYYLFDANSSTATEFDEQVLDPMDDGTEYVCEESEVNTDLCRIQLDDSELQFVVNPSNNVFYIPSTYVDAEVNTANYVE